MKESLFGLSGGTPSNVTSIGSSYPPQSTSTQASSTAGVKDVFLGIPETEDALLPDLRFSKEPTTDDVINQSLHDTTELNQDIDKVQGQRDFFFKRDLHVLCFFYETIKIQIINLVVKSSINGHIYENIYQV